ncbi:hypothetical protein AYI69_g5304 [Smittium culicis]|uniref:Uncharacterized protein n=1 Tax=Smittium culicis TaxID=133412 RepID=A0A1R1Y6R8_9FUNG|nr:hypothetical protein AYI69_g5304 [Smittium culicis]
MLAEFKRTLYDDFIVSFVRLILDIKPVLDTFKDWGPASGLAVKRLTAKLCWLLLVAGYFRVSDIHSIDDERSHITQCELNLVIVAPKEKRAGRLIENPWQITTYTYRILCPVLACSFCK